MAGLWDEDRMEPLQSEEKGLQARPLRWRRRTGLESRQQLFQAHQVEHAFYVVGQVIKVHSARTLSSPLTRKKV
jgi:hypothetical protein